MVLESHGVLQLHVLPNTIKTLHAMMSLFYAKIGQYLLVSLRIPLSTYSDKFKFYKILKHGIKVPNSKLSTILDTNVEYIGIDALSGDYIVVDAQQASAIQASARHIIKQPIIHIDGNESCLVSIFYNDKKGVDSYCHYLLEPSQITPTVTRLGDNKFLLQNIKDYSIICSTTMPSNVTTLVNKTIHYSSIIDCVVNLNDFDFSDMNIRFT